MRAASSIDLITPPKFFTTRSSEEDTTADITSNSQHPCCQLANYGNVIPI
jgi:hypothetical protein